MATLKQVWARELAGGWRVLMTVDGGRVHCYATGSSKTGEAPWSNWSGSSWMAAERCSFRSPTTSPALGRPPESMTCRHGSGQRRECARPSRAVANTALARRDLAEQPQQVHVEFGAMCPGCARLWRASGRGIRSLVAIALVAVRGWSGPGCASRMARARSCRGRAPPRSLWSNRTLGRLHRVPATSRWSGRVQASPCACGQEAVTRRRGPPGQRPPPRRRLPAGLPCRAWRRRAARPAPGWMPP
jgi:hypothetical protein